MIGEQITNAIALAKKSVSAGVPEANIENTYQAFSSLLDLIPLEPGVREDFQKKLRTELEDGLAQRRKESQQ